MTINGNVITATEFAFDNCHKIYLVNIQEDKDELTENGYDFYPIEQIKEAYEGSCSLRFIQDMTTFKDIVEQFKPAKFRR